ncbi:MAG TPA: DUF2062 domain-containing protein [Steroidobacteraceae bacterium]|nr:DUF2062 domain-containing protein [Steroidobacteraceae bacterium]
MPRDLLKKIAARKPAALTTKWYLRGLGKHLADPRLWCLQRRSVTGAFGAGLAIGFMPLPIHMPLATAAAITWRLNIPVALATVWYVNPLTMVPIYYVAYRVGALLTGVPAHAFWFRPSWDWLQHGLGPMWKPFLVGCLACSMLAGVFGWLGLELLWRWRVLARRSQRPRRPTPA